MFAFKHNFYAYLEEYFINFFNQDDETILNSEALLPELVKDKIKTHEITLKKVTSDSMWFGMTYKEDLPELKANILNLINEGEYPSKLWE